MRSLLSDGNTGPRRTTGLASAAAFGVGYFPAVTATNTTDAVTLPSAFEVPRTITRAPAVRLLIGTATKRDTRAVAGTATDEF